MRADPWIAVTGWCPVCWWNQTGEFHFMSRPHRHQAYMDLRHQEEKGNVCKIRRVNIARGQADHYLIRKYGGV